jgi:hypothetical protein
VSSRWRTWRPARWPRSSTSLRARADDRQEPDHDLGPKDDGTYVVKFRTSEGDALAISIPRSETHVIRHFQERMPYGLFVPDVPL